MKKSIIISIKPKWVEKILNGEKTIEIRKSIPKCELPIDVYIYCTKPNKYPNTSNGKKCQILTFNEKTKTYNLWHSSYGDVLNGKIVAKFTLSNIERFDVPYPAWFYEVKDKLQHITDGSCLTLLSLHHYLKNDSGFAWHINNLEIFDKPMELSEFYKNGTYNLDDFIYNLYEGYNTYADYLLGRRLKKAPQSWCYCYKEN